VEQFLFYVVSAAALLNGATIVLSIVRPDRRVWPPPGRDSWQYTYNGLTSFTGLLGFIALGIFDRNSLGFHHAARFAVGALLIACGFFGLWGYLTLGVHVSKGLGGDLVTAGPYRYSRNPQYVGALAALLGCAILCNSALALIAAPLLGLWFVLLPFAEEPWCREHLGAAYEEYSANVPRFLGLRRRGKTQ
jgi:protein-S-isoprenylcysteine O-methyltransferase Ste14